MARASCPGSRSECTASHTMRRNGRGPPSCSDAPLRTDSEGESSLQPITCRQCGAEFVASPELPAVFTCGGCGADVHARVLKPVPHARPPHRVPRPEPKRASADGMKPGLVLGISGGAVALL